MEKAPVQTPRKTPPHLSPPSSPAPLFHGRKTRPSSSPKTPPAEPNLDATERERNQRLSVIEGSATAVSTGLTANFITPFALALGASNQLIAMLSSLPSLIGAVAQLGVQRLRPLFDTRRKYLAVFAFLQAILWLPLIIIPALPYPAVWLVILVVLNTIVGFLMGPVWNSLTGDIVLENERGRFFGRRNTWTGTAAFVATLLAGLLLSALQPTHPLLGFVVLFLLAFFFRAGSAWLFSRMGKPPEGSLSTALPEPQQLLFHANRTAFGRFTLFLVLLYIAVNIASPFFAVYQLKILGFTYLQFTLLASVSAITSFLTTLIWGKYVDRIGARAVLLSTGLLVPLVPLFWTLTTNIGLLIFVEALSGAAWAGFNLSASTYIFDSTDREHRTRLVAEHTLLIQLALFLGAMLGGWVLSIGGAIAAQSYLDVFFLSAALRFIIVIAFLGVIKEQRMVEVPVRGRIFRGFVTIRPSHGVVYESVVENQRVTSSPSPKDVRDRFRTPPSRPPRTPLIREEYEKGFEQYRRRDKERHK